MSATPRASDVPTLTGEPLMAVLYLDEELVRAEFDAIIAAEWPTPPTRPPRHTVAVAPVPPGGPAGASVEPGCPQQRAGHVDLGQLGPEPVPAERRVGFVRESLKGR